VTVVNPALAHSIRTPHGAVSITPFAATIRYHGGGDGYGSPFTFVCTAAIVGAEVQLFAAAGKMTPRAWRAIGEALRQLGFNAARFERRNAVRKRVRRVTA
jgi:hypothetical protein